jgi:ribosomal protein S18 acetylase RimI-like enzyme
MANKPTLDDMRLALTKVTRPPQQTNLDMAREEAERIGQHHDPHTRSLQQGYEHDWYHGGTGNVKAFDPKTLGESTGAASAKKGFFFARDPSTPPPEMLEHDPESVEFLKKLGKPIPPKKTMEGHGSATASSYAGTGGSREYKEAMRMAKAAERVGNWSEYEKYMQIAEDAVINDMRYRQDLVAKHGDARDQMYEDIKNAWYGPHNAEMFKGMSQPDYEAHDKRYKELMPYGWHIDYQKPHYDVLKKELQKFGKHKQIESALKSINHYQSVHNERKLSELESGANVMPVALRYKNPMYHDFKGNSYRDQTYSDLMDEAKRKGHDALILKNTFDPGGSGTPKMVDVGVMFHPNQVRSKFAAFDPTRTHESDLLAAKGGVAHMAVGGPNWSPHPENDLLQPIGSSKMVGEEKLIADDGAFKSGLSMFPSRNKSYRYVYHGEGDAPIGAMQIATQGPRSKKAVIQNLYVAEANRRQGIASKLLDRARKDFEVKHSNDLTTEGKAFAKNKKAKGGEVHMSEGGKPNDAAFIGYLSPHGKFESYPESVAKANDYHHSYTIKDLDAYNAEGGLTFVRMNSDPEITIKGTPAMDPFHHKNSPMVSDLARRIIKSGGHHDMPIKVEHMGFEKHEAPYQGKYIGTLRQWSMRNAEKKAKGGNIMPKYPSIEEMLQKLQESGRTPIMPAPDRWFKKPEQHPFQQKAIEKLLAYTGHNREAFPHGAHINPVTGEPLDFEIMHDLGVAIDPMTGTPRMSGIKSGLTEIDPKLGSLTKSNLIRKGLFKHEGGDPLLDRIKFLATIEKSGKGHHYGLSTHYESPAELVQEMRGNPTLRPHSRGDIYGVGDEVGRISIKGMHHPVFEKLVVAPSGMNVQGKKLHKANGGKVTHAHHLEIEERPL